MEINQIHKNVVLTVDPITNVVNFEVTQVISPQVILEISEVGRKGEKGDNGDNVQPYIDNVFITMPAWSSSANWLKIHAGGKWKYNGVINENLIDFEFTVPYCAAGKQRLDYFVPNQYNGFTKISGVEVVGIAKAPLLPVKDFFYTYFLVTDSIVGVPEEPTFEKNFATLSDLEEKLDKSTYTGNAQDLDTRIDVLENLQNLDTNFTDQAFAVWTGVGFIYDVIYPSYYIQGVLYPGATEQITLNASNVTHPRQDVIAVDATGAIKITGVAEANPLVPTIDNDTQIYITTVLVNANATTPVVTQETIYKENIEWTTVSNNGTVNFNALTTPFQGTKHIDCGAFTDGQYLRFTDSVVNQVADFSTLKFYLNLKGALNTNTKLIIKFYNGGTLISSGLKVNSGSYNFNRLIIDTYQTIVIPLSAFTFTASGFDRIEFVTMGASATGFRLDNFVLSADVNGVSPKQNAITTIATNSGILNATTPDDTISIVGLGKSTVSATGKVITINTPSEVVQTITNGSTTTAPSEDVVFDALANKVDKVTGKSLILDTEITRLSTVTNYDNSSNATALSNKVDKVTGERLINAGEIVKLGNTSNTNTGDETAATIIAKIGDGTKINQSYLPSYVDDVLEFANLAGFPATGESGKIYVAIDSSKQYRWTGSAYLQITNGLIATTNDVPEGSSLYFTTARVLATLLTGISFATGGAIVSTDSVLVAFGKIQKQITDALTAIGLKQDTLVSGTNIKTINGTSVLGSGDIALVIAKATDALSGTVKTDVPTADPVVYTKETTDTLLQSKANYFLGIKPITGITYNLIMGAVIEDGDILKQLVYAGTLAMNVIIPNNETVPFPIGTIFYTVATNTGVLSISGGAGVVFQTSVGLSAGQNEVRKYTKRGINTWGVEGGVLPVSVVSQNANVLKTYYVDTINGNNATAQEGNIFKPYKTIDPIFAFCGYSEPVTYNNIVLLTSGTYYINSAMPQYARINFLSDKKIIISFENNINAQLLAFASNNNYYRINIPYGNIVLSNTVDQYFSGDNWEILCDEFYTSYGTNTIFQNCSVFKFKANKTTLKKALCNSTGNFNYYVCPNTIITGTNVYFISNNQINTLVDIRGVVTGTGDLSISRHSGEAYVGNVTLTGSLTIGSGDSVVTFFNSKLLVTTIYVATDNSGQLTLSGVIHPTSVGMSISYTIATTIIFKNLTHDFKNIVQQMSSTNYIFDNVNLICDTVFFSRNTNGKIHKMYGVNNLFSRSPSVLMSGNVTTTIEDYGEFRTNIPSLGTTVTYLKKNTALMFLPSFLNDADAATGGIPVGFEYINSTTGALHKRLT